MMIMGMLVTVETEDRGKFEGVIVSLKLGNSTICEFFMSGRDFGYEYPPTREDVERFLAAQLRDIITNVADLKNERDNTEERVRMYGE